MLNQNQMNASIMDGIFEPFIKKVLETQSFGVSRKAIELDLETSPGKRKQDCFNFSIPYAGKTLHWTVLFNLNFPELGPDFEFHDDSFLADPDAKTIETHIPSLAKWQSMNPESLLNVFTELTQCYKQHQIDLLSANEKHLYMEYTMLIDKTNVGLKDVEIILLPNAVSTNEVRFVIRLMIDFSRLPGRSNETTDDAAMLFLTFQQPNWTHITPQLYLSKSLEETFGGSGALHIPPLLRNKCVKDYVPEIKKIITDKMNTVIHCYEKRNNFIATLLFLHRRNVVEYDAIEFTRVTMLIEHQDFYFLVHILLPPGFPEVQPMVSLQSIYHITQKDELVKKPISQYPYSPRWPSTRMINSILHQIMTNDVELFKQVSVVIPRG